MCCEKERADVAHLGGIMRNVKWLLSQTNEVCLFMYFSGFVLLVMSRSVVCRVYLQLCFADSWCNTPQPGPYKAPVVDEKKTSTLSLPRWTVSSHHRATDRLQSTLDIQCTAKPLLSAP